jgi:type IV pilus assembly protein PilC
MPLYSYVAKDAMGRAHTGTSEAENEQILVRTLRERGWWVQKIQEERAAAQAAAPAAAPRFTLPLLGRVSGKELSMFCRQFATMINAGVSMVRCLAVLEEQTSSVRLKDIIRDIQAHVEAGETLSRSLQNYPRVFSNLFVGLVKAGEVGGVLDETLNRLATFLEEDQKLRRKVRAAMTYPALVLTFAVAVVIGLVTFVLPRFMEVFRDLGIKELPWSTQVLASFSNLLTTKWYLVILTLVLVVTAVQSYTRTRTGRRHWHWLKLHLPVFGRLNHMVGLARFARTLSTLMVSGVPILAAMETVAGALDNDIISEAVLAARSAIREGERIGDPLQKSGLCPPMVIQMISIGEETGSLDAMLAKVAEFYEAEVDATLQSLTAALEPLMIVGLGVVVCFILIAMWMPMVSVIQTLSSGDVT